MAESRNPETEIKQTNYKRNFKNPIL